MNDNNDNELNRINVSNFLLTLRVLTPPMYISPRAMFKARSERRDLSRQLG
jgi:hypothetical protein